MDRENAIEINRDNAIEITIKREGATLVTTRPNVVITHIDVLYDLLAKQEAARDEWLRAVAATRAEITKYEQLEEGETRVERIEATPEPEPEREPEPEPEPRKLDEPDRP